MNDVHDLAAAVAGRQRSAASVVEAALDRVARHDPALNCFTRVRGAAALAEAAALDAAIAAGQPAGLLAGVPFAVKNLFDVAGDTTVAGSVVLADAPPAVRDATVVARLRRAGAILLGQLNMDEFAYGFATENLHYGDTANPHDLSRIAGGSSGGSAAAVAAGLVPLSLGTDTNGSIRVPASLCGVWGCKPTYGRLSRVGVFPFVHGLDHVGPLARSVRDLALAYDLMQGRDRDDPSQSERRVEPTSARLEDPVPGLRVGVLQGWFRDNASDQALSAVQRVTDALSCGGATVGPVELPSAEAARSAAFCLTGAEGGALHLPWLRTRAHLYDPRVRDRLIAGATLPAAVLLQAQRIRARLRDEAARLFERVDLLLAPATPVAAVPHGDATILLGGRQVSARANLGLLTQPISFIGLPVVSVPAQAPEDPLPIGVQLIARPWAEGVALRVARRLERDGVSVCRRLAYD